MLLKVCFWVQHPVSSISVIIHCSLHFNEAKVPLLESFNRSVLWHEIKICRMNKLNQRTLDCPSVLPLIKEAQNQHGLRHGDHQRYR